MRWFIGALCCISCTTPAPERAREEGSEGDHAQILAPPASADQPAGPGDKRTNLANVSMLQLLASPERMRDRWVRLIGFAVFEFEGNAVYLHEEDFRHLITPNALWLDLRDTSAKSPDKPGYMIIEGRFEPDVHGHMDLFSGALVHIQRLTPWPGRGERKDPAAQ